MVIFVRLRGLQGISRGCWGFPNEHLGGGRVEDFGEDSFTETEVETFVGYLLQYVHLVVVPVVKEK